MRGQRATVPEGIYIVLGRQSSMALAHALLDKYKMESRAKLYNVSPNKFLAQPAIRTHEHLEISIPNSVFMTVREASPLNCAMTRSTEGSVYRKIVLLIANPCQQFELLELVVNLFPAVYRL